MWCERAAKAADLKPPAKERLACFVAKFAKDGETIVSAKRVKNLPASAPAGSELMAFYVHVQEPSSWYNDQAYLDTMSDEAVAKFLEVTHEAYLKNNGKEFGKTIPGVFTDEPNYVNGCEGFKHAVPWTAKLPKVFQKRFGYDVLDYLPELGYDFQGMEFSKARHDFYEVVTTLFVQNFGKLIGDWCGKHGLMYTGHVLSEDDMSSQRRCVGSAMRFYEFQQQPGIDLLCENWDPIDTAKQCSSVAHQLDKPTRLCECYGVTGWDFPFAGHKALGDWLAVLGINFRCPHLAWYSMAAEAKRDYPASISFQSSWYPYYSLVENYFARQNAALRPGEEVRDVLVVHPIEHALSAYRPDIVHGAGVALIFPAWAEYVRSRDVAKFARLVKEVDKKVGLAKSKRPFFMLSHKRPGNALVKLLAPFRNGVGFFGHWHASCVNWNNMYFFTGATFPHIEVPSCEPRGSGGLGAIARLPPAMAGVPIEGVEDVGKTRQGYVVRVYDDMLVISRREFGVGGSLGPARSSAWRRAGMGLRCRFRLPTPIPSRVCTRTT